MSIPSASFVRRALSLALGFALLALVALPACGRSNLDDYLLTDGGPLKDGGPDVVGDVKGPDNAACNATTCPSGCCDATGVCRAGATITQCGQLGETCQNCAAEGFQLCDSTRHACGNPVASCDPTTCGGCCEGNVCFAGSDPNQCGLNGQACLHCESSGLTCSPQQQCVQPPCGPQTCTGCCFGQDCIAGTDPTACGIKGAVCTNCVATGGTCVAEGATGGVCEGQTTCNASNCPGCCIGNVCAPGTSPTECGLGGQQCSNCQAQGGACLSTGGKGGGICEITTTCNAQTCPGCCVGNSCLPGTDPNECGIGGQACENCATIGGVCVVSGGGFGGFCETNQFCGPGSCPGCCEGNACVPGFDPTACGNSGQPCSDCTQFGETCGGGDGGFGGFCQGNVTCGPTNCGGCCAGDTCLGGFDPAACGFGGKLCTDCTALGETCGGGDGGFGVCVKQPPPVCDATTCPTGCCDGLDCLPGNLDSFCGTAGAICTNCAATNKSCKAQACVAVVPTCNATNCTGCCDQANVCQPGFIDTQCGESGSSCQDCTVIVPASTCDVSVTPRLCQNEQVQCPAPYPSCPAALETPSPMQQNVCSASDLQNAQSACEGGAHSTACDSFFTFEKAQNPACASCLAPFDYDFSELQGLTTCVAPFTDATCNHITACLVDCTDKSCAMCADAGALQQCQNQVPNTVCSSYYQDAQCIDNAFFGPGAFCNPGQGSGLFGDWLQPVGQYYCGQ